MERLEFSLPAFVRMAWVGEAAREAWEPRLLRVAQAWQVMQWVSVQNGLRPCAIIRQSEAGGGTEAPWARHGLSHEILPEHCTDIADGFFPRSASVGKEHQCLLIATPSTLGMLDEAWQTDGRGVIRRLLGYPDCCNDFYSRIRVHERFIDTTWWMAVGTTRAEKEPRTVEVRDAYLTNLMWQVLDVRAVPHYPCSFDCSDTIALGREMLEAGRRAGYADEVAWLEEILSWPVEWSALHGIAEVKTPILKLITNTDATPVKYTVRLHGASYPEAGARGVAFPYQGRVAPTHLVIPAHRLGRVPAVQDYRDDTRDP